jgi:hypothetical protein
MGLVQPKGGADDSRFSNMLSGSIPPFLLGGVMSSTQAAAAAAAVEDSGEEADDYCDVFDAEEWQIRDLSVGEHAVEEQRMPEHRRLERPSAATSNVSWKQWTPAEVANFVRGLTSDFGEKANVYAETLFKEDIDSDVLANFSPGNLQELGLSLGHGFKLLHRFKEAQPPGTFPDPPGRHWTLGEPSQTLRDAETEELTHVDSGSARRVPVPEDAGRPPLPFVGASMLTAAAGDGKGQYIHTSPATVHMPVPEESQLPATSLAAAVTAAHQNGSRNANCNPPPDWSSGLGSRGLFNWTRQDIELARKSPATPLHTRGDGSQNSAAQTQRAQLTKEDLKKVQDVNTLPAFDPDATAGLGQHPSFFKCPCHN